MEYKPEDVQKEYRQMAASYDQGSLDCNWSAPKTVKECLERRGLLKPGTRIVDFASGTGLLSEEFRDRVGSRSLHITALDLSRDMLAKLKDKNVVDVLRQQNITKPWNIPKESFDIAAATGVGEYLTDHQLSLTIKNSADVLKKHGHLAFTYRPDNIADASQKLHNPNTVKKIFQKAGFEILEDKRFAAYTTDNGETVNHQFVLARKF